MPDDPLDDRGGPTLSEEELAALSGTTVQRIRDLRARGVLRAIGDRHAAGDVHRIRAMGAFEAAGVTIDALVAAQERGDISFATYDEPHRTPGRASGRDLASFRASLGHRGERLREVFVAAGIAEPPEGSHLTEEEERYLERIIATIEATGQPDLALRTLRLFAEAARRASEATLGVYAEAVRRVTPTERRLSTDEEYERVFAPWVPLAREAPQLASWLTATHLSRAIDRYSAAATERTLVQLGYLAERTPDPPGIAFVDLTGFTRLAEEQGDEVAAGIALRLAELAQMTATGRGGRVVKLLGDGVILWLPDARAALDATLALLESLDGAGLPAGHAGIHAGPVIERDGDVFGRSVNLAARLAEAAPSGEIYLSAEVAEILGGADARIEPVGLVRLDGVGDVAVHRLSG